MLCYNPMPTQLGQACPMHIRLGDIPSIVRFRAANSLSLNDLKIARHKFDINVESGCETSR